MEKELNIAAILKEKPNGVHLYDILHNKEVKFDSITNLGDEIVIWCNDYINEKNKFYDFGYSYSERGTARGYIDGLQILKPSKEMQDWSKFAWKKGDVLTDNISTICMFDDWANDDYTEFKAKYTLHLITSNNAENEVCKTNEFVPVLKEEDRQSYVATAETFFNVNLTKGSLEIEKQPEFKDGDIVCFYNGKGCYDTIAIIKEQGKEIFEVYTFLEIPIMKLYLNKDKFYPYTRTPRPATDSEKEQLFEALAEEGKRWDADKKELVDLPKKCEFKAFDKVLVRDTLDEVWVPSFFSNMDRDGVEYRYGCITGNTMVVYNKYCIPYNDQTKHLLGTTDDLEGGEG